MVNKYSAVDCPSMHACFYVKKCTFVGPKAFNLLIYFTASNISSLNPCKHIIQKCHLTMELSPHFKHVVWIPLISASSMWQLLKTSMVLIFKLERVLTSSLFLIYFLLYKLFLITKEKTKLSVLPTSENSNVRDVKWIELAKTKIVLT